MYDKINSDFVFKAKPSKVFSLSPLSIPEIQYLKSLVIGDKLNNKYEEKEKDLKIDQETSMHEFTENILKVLEELENQ